MQYYLRPISITRDEVLAEPATIVKKDEKGKVENVMARKAGDEINTIYSVDSHIITDGNTKLLNVQDLTQIKNIIKAYIMLFGEEKIDESKISDFVKKQTGKDVKFIIDKISKKYCHPDTEKFPYYSEDIEVNLINKNIDTL